MTITAAAGKKKTLPGLCWPGFPALPSRKDATKRNVALILRKEKKLVPVNRKIALGST
jgi:hypothetical protein